MQDATLLGIHYCIKRIAFHSINNKGCVPLQSSNKIEPRDKN